MRILIHPLKENPQSSPARTLRQRAAALASRQWGHVHWRQLRACGVSQAAISRWLAEGYLHLVHPRVYAVGHTARSIEGDHMAALLYAGPGAMLSHETAAWWWVLTADRRPRVIEVSTQRDCSSLQSVRVHARRRLERTWHRRLPVTSVEQTLLDFASAAPFRRVRYALAEADYQRLLDFTSVEQTLGRGRPGSLNLRSAIAHHRPELAYTRNDFELRFLELCELGELPIPKFNVKVMGLTVDALWRDHKVIVELDGKRGHGTPAQISRDQARDLTLRAAGFTVLRYSWRQITREAEMVLADLRRALGLV